MAPFSGRELNFTFENARAEIYVVKWLLLISLSHIFTERTFTPFYVKCTTAYLSKHTIFNGMRIARSNVSNSGASTMGHNAIYGFTEKEARDGEGECRKFLLRITVHAACSTAEVNFCKEIAPAEDIIILLVSGPAVAVLAAHGEAVLHLKSLPCDAASCAT